MSKDSKLERATISESVASTFDQLQRIIDTFLSGITQWADTSINNWLKPAFEHFDKSSKMLLGLFHPGD